MLLKHVSFSSNASVLWWLQKIYAKNRGIMHKILPFSECGNPDKALPGPTFEAGSSSETFLALTSLF